jgi:hypothetical protein
MKSLIMAGQAVKVFILRRRQETVKKKIRAAQAYLSYRLSGAEGGGGFNFLQKVAEW